MASSIKIVSTGCYIPSNEVPSAALDKQFGLPPGTIEQKTGIRTRYYGNEIETSPYMGAKAVQAALDRAQLTLDDVDALVSVSGSPAQFLPSTASLILAKLSVSARHMSVFDMDATCLSFLVGLDQMALAVATGRYRRVVLVASENGSSHLSPHEWESAALIGDVAVALVIERAADDEPSRLCASSFMVAPKGHDHARVRVGGTVFGPRSSRTPQPDDAYFAIEGREMLRLGAQLTPGFYDAFFTKHEGVASDVDWFLTHHASEPAMRFVVRLLGWPEERHLVHLRDYGNTIAASIPFGLHLAIEQGRLQRGHKVLMYGQGAGLVFGLATIVY